MRLRFFRSAASAAASLALALLVGAAAAIANPTLVVDVDSGQVLIDEQATTPWYPASVTKLMTTYVALQAVRDGRLTLDTPLVVSARAARMPPSKMGFRPGLQVTLDNALKMLMVKSPNDVAVTVAEGVSGSVESFADEMNATARRLGLQDSHFVNPNGLHDPRHYSSARDMAMIGRALLKDFPEHSDLFNIGALSLDGHVIPNHNGLLGRYPGADGMKTGFTCAAGFNVVASASQGGRRLIAVVLGAPSARERTIEAAGLFDRGFSTWSGHGALDALPSTGGEPVNQRGAICSRHNAAAIAAAEEENMADPIGGLFGRNTIFAAITGSGAPTRSSIMDQKPYFEPVAVYVGARPGWTGPVLAARAASAPLAAAALPGEAKAYSAEKTNGLRDETGPADASSSAPLALEGAVRTPVEPIKAAAKVRGRQTAGVVEFKRGAAPKPPAKLRKRHADAAAQ